MKLISLVFATCFVLVAIAWTSIQVWGTQPIKYVPVSVPYDDAALRERMDRLQLQVADFESRLAAAEARPQGLSGQEVRSLIEMLAPQPNTVICPEDITQPCAAVEAVEP